MKPFWPGETVVCVGSGPSLTATDVEACRGRARVIVVNDAYRLAPWADFLYAADLGWWLRHGGVPAFEGRRGSLGDPEKKKGPQWPADMLFWQSAGVTGLAADATSLKTGQHSGYQAIGIAVHARAVRILLLGYDLQRTGDKGHWFGEHPITLTSTKASRFQQWRRHYATLVEPLRQRGIALVNCSRESALTLFPRRSIQDALEEAKAA